SVLTQTPESSASAGNPVRRDAWRAFAIAFSTKVGCGSSASGTLNSDCVCSVKPSGASSAPNSFSLPALLEARTRGRDMMMPDGLCRPDRRNAKAEVYRVVAIFAHGKNVARQRAVDDRQPPLQKLSGRDFQHLFLHHDQIADAVLLQIEQLVHRGTVECLAFRRTLYFDEMAG